MQSLLSAVHKLILPSFVDPNTLYLDLDPEMYPNLDLDLNLFTSLRYLFTLSMLQKM